MSYLTFDFYPNRDLFENIQRNGPLPEAAARFYFDQLLTCIEYMHSKGFVHRDIKLENVILDNDFNLKLIDFGLAENSRSIKGKH